MNSKKWEVNWEKAAIVVFYIMLSMEIIIVIIDKSNYINPIEGQLFRITILLAALKILLTKYTGKEWGAIILFGVLGFISYKSTGRNEILRIVVFVAACKSMDMKKVLKYTFYLTLSGCLLLVFLSVTGIYGGLYREEDFGRGFQIRYCLGLGHPNALHCMFLMLVLLGLYLYNEKMKWYYYFVIFLINYALYVLTDSNTGMLITLCTIAGAAVIRYWKSLKDKKWVYLTAAVLFLFCVTLSILLAAPRFVQPINYSFNSQAIIKLDSLLNGRINDLYYGSDNSEGTTTTWSLFSQPENTYYFDMGFVRVFYWYGVIPGIIYVIMHLLLIRAFYHKKDGMGVVMITVLTIYTIVEAHIVSVYIGRNYLLFLMGMYMGSILHIEEGTEVYLWKGLTLFNK